MEEEEKKQPEQQPAAAEAWQSAGAFDEVPGGKKRGVAAILAILLGGFGAQYFYLGKTKAAIICLAVSIVSCCVLAFLPGIFGLVQGIMMFVGDNQTFYDKYINTDKMFPMF